MRAGQPLLKAESHSLSLSLPLYRSHHQLFVCCFFLLLSFFLFFLADSGRTTFALPARCPLLAALLPPLPSSVEGVPQFISRVTFVPLGLFLCVVRRPVAQLLIRPVRRSFDRSRYSPRLPISKKPITTINSPSPKQTNKNQNSKQKATAIAEAIEKPQVGEKY